MKTKTKQEIADLHERIRRALRPTLTALVSVLVSVYRKDPAAAREIRRLVVKDVETYFDEAFEAIEDGLEKEAAAARRERGQTGAVFVTAATVVLFLVVAGVAVLGLSDA